MSCLAAHSLARRRRCASDRADGTCVEGVIGRGWSGEDRAESSRTSIGRRNVCLSDSLVATSGEVKIEWECVHHLAGVKEYNNAITNRSRKSN